jgi:hypothetical protein
MPLALASSVEPGHIAPLPPAISNSDYNGNVPIASLGKTSMRRTIDIAVVSSLFVCLAGAAPRPLFKSTTARPLRYHPEGKDFVIVNGSEFFNRPLYGSNTAFRVDAGDRPEFSLYLPGRGGNLRIGIKKGGGAKWLNDAENIVSRYRAAEMMYEIHDPLLGSGMLELTVLAFSQTEGLVVRAMLSGVQEPVELVWAYGGASGERGSRDGDIGTEREPVSRYFQLSPGVCRGNAFEIERNRFVLHGKTAELAGVFPEGSKLAVSDAKLWQSYQELVAASGVPTEQPVAIGEVALQPNQPAYLAVQRVNPKSGADALAAAPAAYPERPDARLDAVRNRQETALLPFYNASDLPRAFDEAEAHFRELARSITVDTPDAFINAAASAIGIAADGVWDEPQSVVMHGAVAWRARLLGWRGAYMLDDLGWHERMTRHLTYWNAQQNTSPIVQAPIHPDPGSNLARTENALHSNGDMSKNHYDMNLVYIDELMRHLLWTGDVEFARRSWPVIERHLAWERRLFRRTYGPDKLPLYEAYNVIWASDNLQYDGGGATHSSAYNYFQNKTAARIARWIGQDPAQYEAEAAAILKAMRSELWLPKLGIYAESRDILGLGLAHPSPGAWTFFHTVDSEAATPMEAYQMARFVDTGLGHIPIHGPGVPEGAYSVLAYTNWMPYIWSINNVVMGDNMHTALGLWQSGLDKQAFDLYKGNILDSMYMGLCPGDVHMSSQFDDYRQESQRDFADPIAMTARATIEGLFGVAPDMLAGEVRIQPGFPAGWDHAVIEHRDFSFSWRREGAVDTYSVALKFAKPAALRLVAVARAEQIESITVNGRAAEWHTVEASVGTPRIEIFAPSAPQFTVRIAWKGAAPVVVRAAPVAAIGRRIALDFAPARIGELADPQQVLVGVTKSGTSLDALVVGDLGRHSVFAQVHQGQMSWWIPLDFEVRSPLEVISTAEQTPNSLSFYLRNNTPERIAGMVTITAGDQPLTRHMALAPFADSSTVTLPADGLPPGVSRVRATFPAGIGAEALITNWNIRADAARWEKVDLSGVWNDRVTQIFRNEYLSPRSPYCSLSIPKQGIGGWSAMTLTAEIDDSGLRAAARAHAGLIEVPQGVPFQTPGEPDANNILFTSQWDNYPHEKSVPLAGKATHIYLLMAGSTNYMQSRMDNGEVIVTYADGTTDRLALTNPDNWWPIEQDYLIDDYQFPRPGPVPPRIDLMTAKVRFPEIGTPRNIPGGAATVLDMPLNSAKELKSLTLRTLANEVVIGLMSATLAR